MKIKNTSKFIIYADGEAVLPGTISTNEIAPCAALDAFRAQGHIEYISGEETAAEASKEADSTDPDADAKAEAIRSVKAMRSEDKLRARAAELGVEVSEADDVDAIKEKLVAYYEAQ